MVTLVLAISVAVLVSFLCSLAEAALYAIPWSAIENLRKSGRSTGELLYNMRTEVDKPIAAILTQIGRASCREECVCSCSWGGGGGAW